MKQIYVIKNIINDLVYVGQAASALVISGNMPQKENDENSNRYKPNDF